MRGAEGESLRPQRYADSVIMIPACRPFFQTAGAAISASSMVRNVCREPAVAGSPLFSMGMVTNIGEVAFRLSAGLCIFAALSQKGSP